MIKYGLSAIVVSLIWFFVRGYLGMPNNTPLFQEGIFLFGDRLAVILGIAGVILTIIGAVQFFREQ
jgi:arginine exporter protein ArgO